MKCVFFFRQMIGAFLAAVFVAGITLPTFGADDDANWRRGRIYYRMVCTSCHKEIANITISPMSLKIAEWKAYIAADKHDKSGRSNASLKYYVGKFYRESIKDSNLAAAKFIDLSEDELLADVRAWAVHGAKDSDTPARCQ